jgi:ferredoxin-NADP reductase
MANPVKLKCIVSSIRNHDDVVSTISLKPSRRLPNFKPGQFLHLALDPFDPTGGFWPESRVFSIASSPFDSEMIIAYSVKGAFTKRMREELIIGKEVWVRLPYGHFSLAASLDEEVVLVAGGTGITPFISFISNELYAFSGVSLKLVYGVRKPELFLFTEVLKKAISQLNGFKLFAFSEDGCYKDGYFSISGGSLSLDKIWQVADTPETATFYLAGPVAMITAFKTGLTSRGVRPDKIHIDEWE